jgi:hypothetical protein
MTTIFVEIASLNFFYDRVGMFCENMLSDKEFLEQIKSALEKNLKKHGVEKVVIKIGNSEMFFNLYMINIKNTRNDWQEEQIRQEVDNTCLDFINRNHLKRICKE